MSDVLTRPEAKTLLLNALDNVGVALVNLETGTATREGVTNVLRHSDARTCSISVGRRNAMVFLEIINDGTHKKTGEGRGLAGLAERTTALGGTVSTHRTKDGQFRLRIEIPQEE